MPAISFQESVKSIPTDPHPRIRLRLLKSVSDAWHPIFPQVALVRLAQPVVLTAAIVLAGSPAPAKEAAAPNPEQLVAGALSDLDLRKYNDALQKALEAEKLQPDSAFILNLVGAAYTKEKHFDTATTYFNRALAAQPGFFPAEFNLGEAIFLQGKYSEALDYFKKLLDSDPGNELLLFKCFLCTLLLDQRDDAQNWLDRIPYPGDTPAWYYAKAAWEQKYGSKSQSSKYLDVARVVYPSKTAIYDETFQDINFAH